MIKVNDSPFLHSYQNRMNCGWLFLFGIWVNTLYIKDITLTHPIQYQSVQTCEEKKCLPDFISPYVYNYCNSCYHEDVSTGTDQVYQYTLVRNKVVGYYDHVVDEKVTISKKNQPKDFQQITEFIQRCIKNNPDTSPTRLGLV